MGKKWLLPFFLALGACKLEPVAQKDALGLSTADLNTRSAITPPATVDPDTLTWVDGYLNFHSLKADRSTFLGSFTTEVNASTIYYYGTFYVQDSADFDVLENLSEAGVDNNATEAHVRLKFKKIGSGPSGCDTLICTADVVEQYQVVDLEVLE